MRSTLVLNASYMPLNVVSAKQAMRNVFNGKAVVEDYSPHAFFGADGKEFRIPYVTRMTYEVKQNRNIAPPRFSRRGVLVRDNYTCAYCGNYGDTIDHIVPQSLGGPSSFENCVTACKSCNNKKSNRTLEQLGWKLDRSKAVTPRNSKLAQMLSSARGDEEMFKTWMEYISWYDAGVKAEKLRLYPV